MKNNTIKFFALENDVGKRLDIILVERIDNLTRSNLKKIIETNNVSINNEKITSPSKKIKANDCISVNLNSKKKKL